MVGKAHRLSWSASGFTVSSSANVIRAICAHTHTHTQTDKHTYKHTKHISPSLRQTATSDGLFPSMDYVWRFTSLQPPLPPPLCAPCLPEWFPMSYWAISRAMALCICVSESVCAYKCVCTSICVWRQGCERLLARDLRRRIYGTGQWFYSCALLPLG